MTPEQIRTARERLGLTLDEFAEALAGRGRKAVDRATVWRWENGRREPPPYLWRAIRDLERERKEQAGAS